MTTPKYKESGHAKSRRLNLKKPHIMFLGAAGWVISAPTIRYDEDERAIKFCIDMDDRHTPRGQS